MDISRKLVLNVIFLVLLGSCSSDDLTSTDNPIIEPEADIDLIIDGRYVVTMDLENTIISNGSVAIDDGVVIDVGTRKKIHNKYSSPEIIDGSNRVVLPGLINGHGHAAMTLLRGVADDLSLMDWLTNYIFPAEVEFVDAEFVRIGTELACWEMVRGGTTTFVDMYYFPDVIAEAVEGCGLRALISATVIDQPGPDADNADDSINKGIGFVERWANRNSRITPIFGPHSIYTLNPDQLIATRETATRLGVPISIHLSESPFEVQYSKDTYGMTSIDMLNSVKFLDGPTIAAHVVWPTDEEISLLSDKGIGVVHNPTSNMKIASGIAPIHKMLAAGVSVGLGTDGAASNNDLDMWEEMRIASFLQKVEQMDPETLPAAAVMRMATIGGAEAIGLGNSVGSIEVGKRADVIQIEIDDVHHIPLYDVISHLVYVTDEQDVSTVVVDGKVLMQNKRYMTLDTERIAAEATELAARIQKRLWQ
ncbi:MAG: 5-methylthioadenosine deaminase [Woeseia sp.]|nr:5-methylthioadenosine deaminase [Woeseia sp.]|tara:strand:+ start:90 stop:1523 length:1434 start_codon:yes stop_codon:yes gene_type:complete